MVYKDINVEREPLRLKRIPIGVIKATQKKEFNKIVFDTTKTENAFASKLYNDFSGLLGIKPTEDVYDTVDFIISNDRLNIEFYAELKVRYIVNKFPELLIGREKMLRILEQKLYPTYLFMEFSTECYVYKIASEEDILGLIKKSGYDSFYFIPKERCIMYPEFINSINSQIRFLYSQFNLNQTDVIP